MNTLRQKLGVSIILWKAMESDLTRVLLPKTLILQQASSLTSDGRIHFCTFSPPVASFSKEAKPRLAERPLKTNGRLANRGTTSLVKEATGINVNPRFVSRFPIHHDNSSIEDTCMGIKSIQL